jgi:flagellar hook-length control protein FliK
LNTTLLGQDLADKMSTAIGKRLLESIEKGEWQLKLQLKPVELGHIEVDLQMKENGLEAKFTASQSMARELLESGLSRLKETLQQSGMDVASVRVNDGLSSRNGGDPTPRHPQQGHHGSTPQENVPNESEAPVAPGNSTISDGRLDLMV